MNNIVPSIVVAWITANGISIAGQGTIEVICKSKLMTQKGVCVGTVGV